MWRHILNFLVSLKPHDLVATYKAMAIGVTGAFGILGLVKNFKQKVRDPETDTTVERITKWGWISLIGIVISSICGVAVQVKESNAAEASKTKTANDTLALAEKNDRMLVDVQRLLTPIGEPIVIIKYTVHCEDDKLEAAATFCEEAEGIKEELTSMNYNVPGNEEKGYKLAADKKVWNGWPVIEDGEFLKITLWVFKDSSDAEKFVKVRDSVEPDLEIEVKSLLKDKFSTKLLLGLTMQNPEIATVNDIDVHQMSKKENMASLRDLAGSTLLVGCTDYCAGIIPLIHPQYVVIGNKQGLRVGAEDFELVADKDNDLHYYRHVFPKELFTSQSSGSSATPTPAAPNPATK